MDDKTYEDMASKLDETEELELKRGNVLKPVPIEWLWPGWLAAGKVHVIAGPPGAGKTTLCMAMIATITSGGRWPSGEPVEAKNVVIWSGEDDPTDTLVPRLIASGADMSRVYFVDRVFCGKDKRAFDPAKDMDLLLAKVRSLGNVGLVNIDPIVSAVTGDSHKNAEVRRSLQPMVDLAQVSRAAVLGVSHFGKATSGKDPVERVVGSIAFSALARVVMAATKVSKEQGGHRILVRAKSNIGMDKGGFKYELQQGYLQDYPGVEASWALWGEALEGEARELLDAAETVSDPEERGERTEAKEFLLALLANGPVSAKQIRKESDENGHAWRTVNRAKKELGIIAKKDGMKDGWRWELPPKNATSPEEGQKNDSHSSGNVPKSWHSSVDPNDLIKALLNGGAGRSAAELRARLGWDEPTFNSIKADLLAAGRIKYEAGGWHLAEGAA